MTAATAAWRRLYAAWRSADLGPSLPQAACHGLAPQFDDLLPGETQTERDQRHRLAVQVCAGCPELPACRELIDQLPPRAGGVYAGVLVIDGRISDRDPNQLALLEETA